MAIFPFGRPGHNTGFSEDEVENRLQSMIDQEVKTFGKNSTTVLKGWSKEELQNYLDNNAVNLGKVNSVTSENPESAAIVSLSTGPVTKGQLEQLQRFDPYYEDQATGRRYEGSAADIRQKIVEERMAANVKAGKYNKKGLFKNLRGRWEKRLDRWAGGDWDPMKGTLRTSRALDDKIQGQIKENRQIHYANQALRAAEKATQDQRAHAKELRQQNIEGSKDLMGVMTESLGKYFNQPEPNAISYRGDAKPSSNRMLTGQELVDGTNALQRRIEGVTKVDPYQAWQEERDSFLEEDSQFTARFSATGGDGKSYKVFSDDKHNAFVGDNSVAYNSQGDPIGYLSGPGKFNWGAPDEKDLPPGMTMMDYWQNVGTITNDDMSNPQSLLYRYKGLKDVPTYHNSLNPYADRSSNAVNVYQEILSQIRKRQ
jgi:hypothetical protein